MQEGMPEWHHPNSIDDYFSGTAGSCDSGNHLLLIMERCCVRVDRVLINIHNPLNDIFALMVFFCFAC